MLGKIIAAYCRLLSGLLVACLAVMVVLVFANVVLRYAFNSGITVSEELSRWLFVWLTFLGAVVALHERAHLGTDMLVSRLSVRGKKICLGAGHLLMLFVCYLVLQGAYSQVQVNFESTSAAMEASLAIFYVSAAVFAVLGGLISPMDGIGPEMLQITPLLQRLEREEVNEVILALTPSVEGDTTSLYLARLLRPFASVSRIAYGLPVGSELEYADAVTLARAFEGRRPVE